MNTGTEISEIKKFLAEMEEKDRRRRGVPAGEIPVDSGSVEFSLDGSLAGVGGLQEQVYELSMGTGRAGFKGRRGFLLTGWGDGTVKVMHASERLGAPVEGDACKLAGSIHVPDGTREIVLGDCGKVYVRIRLESVPFRIFFWWQDTTLWVCG